jgi:DNA-3-methyladenine glycosylase II
MIITDAIAAQATAHLSRHDPRLATIVDVFGSCTIRPHGDYYRELVESIVSQQLSVKAAHTINERFVALFDGTFPSPQQIMATPHETLRSAGLSGAKARYVQEVAQHVLDGRVVFADFDALDNQTIIDSLVAIKGVGEWTAHMFLMFCMGRSDILAYGDLGVRSAAQKLYGLDALPTKAKLFEIAETHGWHPYESIACWYLWKSLDNEPQLTTPTSDL